MHSVNIVLTRPYVHALDHIGVLLPLSVVDFVDKAHQILAGADLPQDQPPVSLDVLRQRFTSFVLTGKSQDNPDERFVIEAMSSAVSHLMTGQMLVTRDYDSLIGVTRDLPYNRAVYLYPIPRFEDTLSKDNHLVHTITVQGEVRVILTSLLLFVLMDPRAVIHGHWPSNIAPYPTSGSALSANEP